MHDKCIHCQYRCYPLISFTCIARHGRLNIKSFAFASSKTLKRAVELALCMRNMVLESPLPFGLTVFVADEDFFIALFFVNDVAFKVKWRKVPSGMSEPGKKFYLSKTNFHKLGNVHELTVQRKKHEEVRKLA